MAATARARYAFAALAAAVACRQREKPPPPPAPAPAVQQIPAPVEQDAGAIALERADAGETIPPSIPQPAHGTKRRAPPLKRAEVAAIPAPPPAAAPAPAPAAGGTATGKECTDCHGELTAGKKVHAPVRDGCRGCHEPKPGATSKCRSPEASAWQLVSTQVELCQKCHPASTGKVHSPIKSSGCTACHDPHASANPALMKRWPLQDACYGCHARVDEDKSVHTPVKSGKCDGCHDPHSSEFGSLLIDEKGKLCSGCHKTDALKHGKFGHAPFTEGRCLSCHDPHSSDTAPVLRASGRALCLTCHDANTKAPVEVRAPFRIDLGKKKIHAPLKNGGACQTCHVQKHGGDSALLLVARTPAELCAKCHPPDDGLAHPHGALRVGKCTGCHDPHSADYPGLLRAPKEKELCFRCHANDLAGRRVIHKPIKDKGCTVCHDAHGSEYANDLIDADGKDLCYKCHAPVDKVKAPHAALTRDGCTGCHDPHGSDNAGLLIRSVNALCSSCHPNQKTGDHVSSPAHKVSGGSDPKHKERAFSCVSCHDPHGTDNPNAFYFGTTKQGMCVYCHGDKTRTASIER